MPGMDGFNALPDSLLTHILSYLPIKEAVRAQLISKRWKNMWAYLPVLNFDFADFWSKDIFSYGEYSTYVHEHSECHENFVRVVDTVLASRLIQQIDKFRLVWKYQVKYYHEHPVRRWILHVLQQSPQMLSIYVQPCDARVDVPDTVFTCPTLVEMKLQVDSSRWPEVLEPASVNLLSLRSLNLGYYTIKADFMNKLLLGCPNLEKLELYTCRVNLPQISCDNLKCLVIDGCCNSTEILVSIPSLQYLKITVMSCQTAGFVFKNMLSLLNASVCFLTADEFPRAFYDNECKILNGLSGVVNLDVLLHGSEARRMLRHALTNYRDFKNLKAVNVESFDGCLIDCMDMVEKLVRNSSTLEDLTFYCCKDGSDGTELLNEMGVIVGPKYCRMIECDQSRIYDSLDKLKKQVIKYMMRFEKMEMEVAAEEEDEEEEDDIEGEALSEGDDGWEVEVGLVEEEEGEDEEDVEQ